MAQEPALRDNPLVLTRAGRILEGGWSRYRWLVVVAVVAVLVSVLAAGKSGSAATSYDAEELQFLRLINDYRQQNGAGPLILSDTLAVAAGRHSEDMGEYGFFGHNTAASSYYRVGSKPWDRMAAEGYTYNTIRGENLATGTETAEEAFDAWRESPSHNAAMLDDRYRVVGIARVYTPGGEHQWYWTTDFGGALDPTSHAPGEDPKAQGGEEQQSSPADEQPQEVAQPDVEEQKEPRRESEKTPKDGGRIENGAMKGGWVWEQKARDGAELILDAGHARLGGYADGADDLRQKIRVGGKKNQLVYEVKIETDGPAQPSDRMLVRITSKKGERLAVLGRHVGADTEGWERQKIDLSRFAGRTVYVGFHAVTDGSRNTTFYVDDAAIEKVKDRGAALRP